MFRFSKIKRNSRFHVIFEFYTYKASTSVMGKFNIGKNSLEYVEL